MTHTELIEAIRDDFIKDFENKPSEEENVKAFREGVKFAYNYLLDILKKGHEWFYEKKGDK